MITVERITKLYELIMKIEESIEHTEGPRWFRGEGDFERFRLTPSLFRHPEVLSQKTDPLTLEARVIARFKQTSFPFLPDRPITELDWIFTAQHFGIPTRLLDWSENPFIALYFALSSHKQDAIPCVWSLDPLLWTKKSLNNPGMARIPEPSDSASLRYMESLKGDLDPRYDPIAIHANHSNPRIVAQRGAFTIFGKGITPMEETSYAKECLRCFVIDPTLKAELYGKLLSIGYTHSVVYPDLSGLGTELKTYFGF